MRTIHGPENMRRVFVLQKPIVSVTPGKIVHLNQATGLMGIETRLGDRILIPIAWSEAETLDVAVISINDQPIGVRDLSGDWGTKRGKR